MRMKLGLLINPVAGLGGKVGLRGSDGADIVTKALSLGAQKESLGKTVQALKEFKANLGSGAAEIITYPGEMGAEACRLAQLACRVVGRIEPEHTTPKDTQEAAKLLCGEGIGLLLFAGGDGTARDILQAVGEQVLVLGIPTGCKIHSGVYGLNPRRAGLLAAEVAAGKIRDSREAEVMDIDEKLFRQNIVQAQLFGYLKIPDDAALMQNSKSGGGSGEAEEIAGIAEYVAEIMEPDTMYVMGTGSTTAAVMKELGLKYSLLGIDLVCNKKLVAADCTERQILEALKKYSRVKVIVTVIGGQGYVFGRGNQQLSASVLSRIGKDNICIIAAKSKLLSLPNRRLYLDTGDEKVNKKLSGYVKVICGYQYQMVMPLGD